VCVFLLTQQHGIAFYPTMSDARLVGSRVLPWKARFRQERLVKCRTWGVRCGAARRSGRRADSRMAYGMMVCRCGGDGFSPQCEGGRCRSGFKPRTRWTTTLGWRMRLHSPLSTSQFCRKAHRHGHSLLSLHGIPIIKSSLAPCAITANLQSLHHDAPNRTSIHVLNVRI
jgi:hypothetical protein